MADDDLTRGLKHLGARLTAYRRYDAYYRGEHRLAFATEKFRSAFGLLFREFSDNLCPAVVDAVSDRLTLVGFDAEGGPEALSEAAWTLWRDNRMDERAGILHTEALTTGDAYLIVWPDPLDESRVRLYPNPGDRVHCERSDDDPDLILWALKAWKLEDGRYRATLYYPDRIEKWVTKNKSDGLPSSSKSFEEWKVDGELSPLPNPYGKVPVFHFPNNPGMRGSGRSELADVLPLQDALNKAVLDMMVAGEYVAFPQRWATGIEIENDPETGEPKSPFQAALDRIWASSSEDAKFGQFEAATLEPYIATQDSLRLEIARVSRTPLHYVSPMSGDFPSGEALRTAEAPFLAKVRDRQVSYGNCWEDALTFALQVQGMALLDNGRLSALWQDPTPRGEKEQAETVALKRDLGISEHQGLVEIGYSEEQIASMTTERLAQIQRDQVLAAEDVVDGIEP